ncbi:AMP-binding protein [Actinomadura opuntiae]|uniref:AMP-binding protein n=1 Tax=Actinomadura sp. OS1-43 TaxID=604315 RepID=UPI00255B1CAD|nr:AMP-binding protein [Actinomadura sp. OS1-43]MDL4816706.1 AMP-binding protein [Actinomadura sp. OS1-43]
MSTSVIEPGTRLAGRYRLEERISDSGGSSLWKAIDEILARAVAVRTFDPEFPRVGEAVTSARAASRLTDPRVTQVFDADDSGESAYVVSEWVTGETLEQMLAKAPLEPGRAATLLYEAAEAIAAAHAAGLAHLCLSPRDLVWTTGGTVKLLGVATDAVLCDRYCDDPAAEDVRGLGRMLYAALTAHWPGDEDASELPAAPAADGVPEAPRQVQAGISHAVDAIVCRCLGIGAAEPLAEPADLAKALRGVPRTPLPLFAGLGNAAPSPRPAPKSPGAGSTATTPQPHQPAAQEPPAHGLAAHGQPGLGRPGHGRRGQDRRGRQAQVPPPRARHETPPPTPPPGGTTVSSAARKPANRALLGVAAAALTVIVGLGAWALSGGGSGDDNDGKNPQAKQSQKSTPPKPATTKLQAQGTRAVEDVWMGGHDEQIDKDTDALIDGSPKSVWHSQHYTNTKFGNLEKGLGVLLDMGRAVKVTKVEVAGAGAGATVQLRVGDQESATGLSPVAEKTSGAGSFTLTPSTAAHGRYVVVWFTELPPALRASLGEVTVYGRAG